MSTLLIVVGVLLGAAGMAAAGILISELVDLITERL